MTTLEHYDFHIHTTRKYRWDILLDGKKRHLKHGVDYHCPFEHFYKVAWAAAKRAGKTLYVEKVDVGCLLQAL